MGPQNHHIAEIILGHAAYSIDHEENAVAPDHSILHDKRDHHRTIPASEQLIRTVRDIQAKAFGATRQLPRSS